ncbi:MAG: hypothetical protein FWG89_11475 [Treponema sp.]|nr:hypothetical protein [Treponema sp.]
MSKEKTLYTLIPIDDFKALMSVDDREDKIVKFCLVFLLLKKMLIF